MGKKLYVGNLSYGVTSETLKELFASYGSVEAADVITDRYSGRSKGFGFVEMSTDQEAADAIQNLDGKEHDGRTLKVNEARPKTDRRGGGGFGGGGGGRGHGRGPRGW
jgi:RNA recognition motif-containing protein